MRRQNIMNPSRSRVDLKGIRVGLLILDLLLLLLLLLDLLLLLLLLGLLKSTLPLPLPNLLRVPDLDLQSA
jgi:hypothetical protein